MSGDQVQSASLSPSIVSSSFSFVVFTVPQLSLDYLSLALFSPPLFFPISSSTHLEQELDYDEFRLFTLAAIEQQEKMEKQNVLPPEKPLLLRDSQPVRSQQLLVSSERILASNTKNGLLPRRKKKPPTPIRSSRPLIELDQAERGLRTLSQLDAKDSSMKEGANSIKCTIS